ncbi:hypothetical protein CEXT_144241 [Caerostris extrusa]|uniref:Uncharacterized protein n=1 Tax=Caerostris extrusa TaxID=172846 RepID=A0AAV4VAX2_CAEEX|nr:hypothetical protein CEXT_144241 [Caerostris extrusa]
MTFLSEGFDVFISLLTSVGGTLTSIPFVLRPRSSKCPHPSSLYRHFIGTSFRCCNAGANPYPQAGSTRGAGRSYPCDPMIEEVPAIN